MTFKRGSTYTRNEIHDVLGGDKQSYLPRKSGRVVCGAFSPRLNPDAPDVVLPGFGPGIEGSAERLAVQSEAIPIFLKRQSNAWEYVGDYRLRELSRDRAVIDRHAARAHRHGQVSMVLFFELAASS